MDATSERYARAALLTLQFPARSGATPLSLRSICFRFCADGTFRSGDNCVAGTRESDGWRICRALYTELECTGPVVVMARKIRNGATESRGPFDIVRVRSGLLTGDDASLGICLPAWQVPGTVAWHEIVLQAVQKPA